MCTLMLGVFLGTGVVFCLRVSLVLLRFHFLELQLGTQQLLCVLLFKLCWLSWCCFITSSLMDNCNRENYMKKKSLSEVQEQDRERPDNAVKRNNTYVSDCYILV